MRRQVIISLALTAAFLGMGAGRSLRVGHGPGGGRNGGAQGGRGQGLRCLRPIILTSLATILGPASLTAETSFQARFPIALAISISFGLVFATVLTLVVIPANYVIVHDLKGLLRRLWHGPRRNTLAGL